MQRIAIISLLLLCLFMTGIRLVALETSPPGFCADEAAIATQVIHLRELGTDSKGTPWPLFVPVLGGGFAVATFLYPGALWTSLFGDSIYSFRALSASFGIMSVIGIFLLARCLFRDSLTALLAALCAAISPWAFLSSRIAWDPAIAPCFLIWGLYFFVRVGSWQRSEAALSAFLLVLAAYAYPPLRMHVPCVLFFFALCLKSWPQIKKIILPFLLTTLVAAYPLITQSISGEIHGRATAFSIFQDHYLKQLGEPSLSLGLSILGKNFLSYFTPLFLWERGDSNLRHSTHFFGQWSPLDLLGIFALLCFLVLVFMRRILGKEKRGKQESQDEGDRRRYTFRVILALLLSYCFGLLPASVLYDANPHALRSISAWPFLSLLAGFGLSTFWLAWRPAAWGVAILGWSFSALFLHDFFTKYPQRTPAWYDEEIIKILQNGIDNKKPYDEIMKHVREADKHYDDLSAEYFFLSFGRGVAHMRFVNAGDE